MNNVPKREAGIDFGPQTSWLLAIGLWQLPEFGCHILQMRPLATLPVATIGCIVICNLHAIYNLAFATLRQVHRGLTPKIARPQLSPQSPHLEPQPSYLTPMVSHPRGGGGNLLSHLCYRVCVCAYPFLSRSRHVTQEM